MEQVKDWNVKCHVPFVEVREIEERESPLPVDYESGFHADPSVSNLIAVEIPAGRGLDVPIEGTHAPGGTWVRSYLDPEREAALALYEVGSAEHSVVKQLESQGWKAHRIVEITPGDYAELV